MFRRSLSIQRCLRFKPCRIKYSHQQQRSMHSIQMEEQAALVLDSELLEFEPSDREASRDFAQLLVSTFDIDLPQKDADVCLMMSGGLDSAFAAWLLTSLDYKVEGTFARCWNEQEEDHGDRVCPDDLHYADVQSTCAQLGIESRQIDLTSEYWNSVFQPFLERLSNNQTPNPDVDCNRNVKFDTFFDVVTAGRQNLDQSFENQIFVSGLLSKINKKKKQFQLNLFYFRIFQ